MRTPCFFLKPNGNNLPKKCSKWQTFDFGMNRAGREIKRKNRPYSRKAFYFDVTLVIFHDFLANSQSQTGPRAISREERGENLIYIFTRNAPSIVFDPDPEPTRPIWGMGHGIRGNFNHTLGTDGF